MLQIATGKLFAEAPGRENHLCGIIYTNAMLSSNDAIETAAGRIYQSSSYSIHPRVLVYELTERMEDGRRAPGVLVSSGIEAYLADFSTLLSFILNCVCSYDVNLTQRLLDGQRGLSTKRTPQQLIRHYFDQDVVCDTQSIEFLVEFTAKIIGLPRKTFLSVMRSIRTYVNGMHRIVDDLELSYTLLVASVESLAQEFNSHKNDWDSVEERKQSVIDEALQGASQDIVMRVREAFLKIEHVALSRRFREFVMANTPSSYFRPLSDETQFLAKSDMEEVLTAAYKARSKYIHELQCLPDMVTLGYGYNDTVLNGRSMYLTLNGLSRLMRNTIINFVMSQPFVEREVCDFRRSGVIVVPVDPSYWVGNAGAEIKIAGRDKLEGFLSQLEKCFLNTPGAALTDLKPVLSEVIRSISGYQKKLQLPYLVLCELFNGYVPTDRRVELSRVTEALIRAELAKPSSEFLIFYALSTHAIPWSLTDHQDVLNQYLRNRCKTSGIRFPRLFEAAIILDFAERQRLEGDVDACMSTFALAVENYPGYQPLLRFEESYKFMTPIEWRSILLPSSELSPK